MQRLTCHDAGGFRRHAVTDLVSCYHSDVVDLTTLQAGQDAGGVTAPTCQHGALIRQSINNV